MSLALERSRLDAAPTAAPFETVVVSTIASFAELRPEWEQLSRRCALPAQVFQQHVFLSHWFTHYGAAAAPRIVVVRRGGRLVSVWPLVLTRSLGLRTLRPLGEPVAQFSDILHDPAAGPEALDAGWRQVRRLGADLALFRRVRADSALAALPALARSTPREPDLALHAVLARRVGTDGPGPAYSPRERSNHRRRLRRLSERGELRFEGLPNGPEAAELARRAVAMKRVALARHGVPAPTVTDPRFPGFFADLAADPTSGLALSLIRCGGEPVGIDMSLDWAGTTFGHVIATHPDHERGGLGQLLIQHSFARAQARGSTVFDLLAPADAYKRDHADGETAVADHLLPLSAVGSLAVAAGLARLRPALKRAVRALPPGLRRCLAERL